MKRSEKKAYHEKQKHDVQILEKSWLINHKWADWTKTEVVRPESSGVPDKYGRL